jgi:hypothetical protein
LARTVQGIAHTWQISDAPIGSGDAGEVYAVARLDQPELTGVMKKPTRVATGGTIQRQAGQIAQEAQALALLEGLPDGKAHPPRLLDQAPEYTKGTANYFMVSETAPGEDLSSLLAESRQTGKPFPRRVIMTVLDALFDMFSRAHKAGVLWNDVKMEHIYWHNTTGKVGVIDWGNALFLDDQGKHSRPRWEDYQQMVDTLGNFLQSSAPDLYVDLGWEEFRGKTLDATLVSTLARRISYQQQVIALQVMEFQSLIRVVLITQPSLNGLKEIAGYQQILEKIGAPWEHDDVLQFCQSLVEKSLADGDIQTTVRTTAQIWEIFGDSLDLPWHLLREYCRHTDILTHSAFTDLAKHTLNSRWEDAIWAASIIASQDQVPIWWEGLIPVMRQKALQVNTPAPYQACRLLRKWAKEHQLNKLVNQLDLMLLDWRSKDQDQTRSPLDYALLDLVRGDVELPNRQSYEIRQSFAQGEEIIRELIKAWRNPNWDELSKALRRIISWDPDRWSVLGLAHKVESLRTWLDNLYTGPEVGTSVRGFLEHMLSSRPEIEHLLGPSPWLSTLINTLNAIIQGAPIAKHQEAVNQYCPWLLQYADIHAADFHPPELDKDALHSILKDFLGRLKSWQDIETGLTEIRQQSPLMYPICHHLADLFKHIFSLNANLEQFEKEASKTVPTELIEGQEALQALITWRKFLAENDLSQASQYLQQYEQDAWRLVAHARQVTIRWHDRILPALETIHAFTALPEFEEQGIDGQTDRLIKISQTYQEVRHLWAQVYDSGIYESLLSTLESRIEVARSTFLDWRVSLENTSDQAERLVYLHQLDFVRQVSNCLLRMTHHIRQAKIGFELLGEDGQTSIMMQKKNISNILYHLTSIEAEIVPEPDKRRFPAYQTSFEHITEAQTATSRQALISALTEDHPFFTWLVKSTLT